MVFHIKEVHRAPSSTIEILFVVFGEWPKSYLIAILPIPDGIPVMSLGFRSQTLDRELQRAWGSKNTQLMHLSLKIVKLVKQHVLPLLCMCSKNLVDRVPSAIPRRSFYGKAIKVIEENRSCSKSYCRCNCSGGTWVEYAKFTMVSIIIFPRG